MITGESQPVHKMDGMKVIAGTINGDGSLRVRVTATGNETALAGIMRLVEQAQQSKSKTQVLADKAAGWLFYIALASAVITAHCLDDCRHLQHRSFESCGHRAGHCVSACARSGDPARRCHHHCHGRKNGILVRNRLALEAAREIDVVIFDKTGTLTQGQFGVVDMVTADGWDSDRALALAAALEGDSEHLIAQAIRRFARDRKLSLPSINNFSALKGRGVQADFRRSNLLHWRTTSAGNAFAYA